MKCIHIGASKCEEAHIYESLGFEDVFYVEAIPYLVHISKQKLNKLNKEKNKNYKCVQALVWNKEDEVKEFHLFNNSTFASIHGINEKNWPWENIQEGEIIKLKTTTLDKLLDNNNINREEYEFLSIDVQGAEYEVLEGCPELLKHVKCMVLEASTIEFYKDQKTFPVLKQFLEKLGFIVENPRMSHDNVRAHKMGYEHYLNVMKR